MYQYPFSGSTIIAIVASGLAAIILAFVWYHPRVFGSAWMRLSGITPEMAERGKRHMLISALVGFLSSMIIAYVMYWFGAAWSVYDVPHAIQLAFWCWIGFTAPVLLGTVIWEQRPFRLYLINTSYWLVTLIVMAIILLY